MQDRTPLVWPTLPGVPSTKLPVAGAAHAAPSTPESPQGSQDVWDYLAEHIDDFAVAKSICDHCDAHPQDLRSKEVDMLGLYLRARVTLKRQQIAYAEMQKALAAAERSSRSLRGRATRLLRFCRDLRDTVRANSAPVLVTCAMALWVSLR